MTTLESQKRPLCKYFLHGHCIRGATCHYAHSESGCKERMRTVCFHYQQGSCRFGDQCRQTHPEMPPVLTSPVISRPGGILQANTKAALEQNNCAPMLKSDTAILCRFFGRGNCTKGVSCPFGHTATYFSPASTFPAPFGTSGYDTYPFPENTVVRLAQPAQQPCKFFMRGECMKGSACKFLHSPMDVDLQPQSGSHPTFHKPSIASSTEATTAVYTDGAASASGHSPDTADGTTECLIFGCTVRFQASAKILNVHTPFDSKHIILSNLPKGTNQDDVIQLGKPYGTLTSVTLDDSSTIIPPTARIEYVDSTSAARAVSSLQGKEFRSKSLVARLDIRPVERGMGLLLSRKVKVSWYAPNAIAWAHYPTVATAKSHARRLDGKTFDGQKISAAFQAPSLRQTESFSVEIRGLPLDVQPTHLGRFCNSSSVTLPSCDRDLGVERVRSHLRGLESFEVLPTDKAKPKITAFAQFSTGDAAAAAVKDLHNTKVVLKHSPLWLEQIHSVKYIVPLRQFTILRASIESFHEAYSDGCQLRYYERDESGAAADPVYVRVYGPRPKALSHLKAGLENLLQGELLMKDGKAIWHDHFETMDREEFLQRINSDERTYVKVDHRKRTLRYFGPTQDIARITDEIVTHLSHIDALRRVLVLDHHLLRVLLTGGLKEVQALMGGDKIVLDVVRKTLTIRGSSQDEREVRKAIGMLADRRVSDGKRNGDAVCPVCYCEATEPTELLCGHIYCTVCLRHLLKSSIGPSFSPLRCICEVDSSDSSKVAMCGRDIPNSVIRHLLSSTEEIELFQSSFLAYIHARPNEFRYCPTPDCQTVYRPAKEGTSLQCTSCLNRICTACHVEYHDGMTCEEHQDNLKGGMDAFRRWSEQNGAKPCPKCHIYIQKSEGCNHMTCINCKTHICWVCMATFEDEDASGGVYNHMSKLHGGLYSE